jgi:hypothetical protein
MATVNTDFEKLVAVHYQRTNYANWTKSPTFFDQCERCGSVNYHCYLYRCFGCDVLHCLDCIAQDAIYLHEFGEFISIFCEVKCKNNYMSVFHKDFTDCDECHLMWPSSEFRKMCEECLNGVCNKCAEKINEDLVTHTHLQWKDRLEFGFLLDE